MMPKRPVFLHHAGLCFIAGALASLSMSPTNLWFLLLGSFSALYYALINTTSTLRAFTLGWVFAFGYFLLSLNWIANALLVEGNEYAWAWPLAVIGMPLMLAPFIAIGCAASYKFSNLKHWSGYLALVGWLSLCEWLRGHLFTGFPWNSFGYSWIEILPMIQISALGSVYLLTTLTILWVCLPAFILFSNNTQQQKILTIFAVILSLIMCYGFGSWRLNHYEETTFENMQMRIIHPDIAQHEKWNPYKMAENYFKHIRLSYPQDHTTSTTYILWPETAISPTLMKDKNYINILTQALQSYNGAAYVLTGVLIKNPETHGYTNSIIMIDRDGHISNIYDKHHLVPFGEYIPFQKWLRLPAITNFSGFEPGDGAQTFTTPEGLSYSPLICYESIFPGRVVDTTNKPDILINTTNDAWYGDSAGPHQHLTHSIMRAVEEGRALYRSANGGYSAAIGPTGAIIKQTNLTPSTTITIPIIKSLDFTVNTNYVKTLINLTLILSLISTGFLRKK